MHICKRERPTCLLLLLVLASTCVWAQGKGKAKPAGPPPAPIPPALAAAKTVFLSNMCEQTYRVCADVYNALYAGISTQGKYQLVASPAEADLVFEMHYVSRVGDVSGFHGDVNSRDATMLHLLIVDRATHVALWSISEPIYGKVNAVTGVLADLSVCTRPGATASPEQTLPGYKY